VWGALRHSVNPDRILQIEAATRTPVSQPPLVVDPASGLLRGVRQVPSPNCDDRPPGVVPDLIVVHAISLPPGQFGGPWIDALFTNTLDAGAHPYFAGIAGLCVSAHVLIRRDGSLTQYVPLTRRAWHAGVSSHFGRERCNDFSVGVEVEGADDVPYEPEQYRTLGVLIHALRLWTPSLGRAPIVGHSDIAPQRKSDPGRSFDWGLLARSIEEGRLA
jgi:AmpD protein